MDEILVKKNIILKKSKSIDLTKLSRVRSYSAIFGIDLKSNNTLIFRRVAKSRFILKDALVLENLANLVASELSRVFGRKIFFYDSEICQKAKKSLEKSGWKCYFAM